MKHCAQQNYIVFLALRLLRAMCKEKQFFSFDLYFYYIVRNNRFVGKRCKVKIGLN